MASRARGFRYSDLDNINVAQVEHREPVRIYNAIWYGSGFLPSMATSEDFLTAVEPPRSGTSPEFDHPDNGDDVFQMFTNEDYYQGPDNASESAQDESPETLASPEKRDCPVDSTGGPRGITPTVNSARGINISSASRLSSGLAAAASASQRATPSLRPISPAEEVPTLSLTTETRTPSSTTASAADSTGLAALAASNPVVASNIAATSSPVPASDPAAALAASTAVPALNLVVARAVLPTINPLELLAPNASTSPAALTSTLATHPRPDPLPSSPRPASSLLAAPKRARDDDDRHGGYSSSRAKRRRLAYGPYVANSGFAASSKHALHKKKRKTRSKRSGHGHGHGGGSGGEVAPSRRPGWVRVSRALVHDALSSSQPRTANAAAPW
ncbi:MAG: hypothetical protein M1832_001220, partial [Thelocarpon impressellum]